MLGIGFWPDYGTPGFRDRCYQAGQAWLGVHLWYQAELTTLNALYDSMPSLENVRHGLGILDSFHGIPGLGNLPQLML